MLGIYFFLVGTKMSIATSELLLLVFHTGIRGGRRVLGRAIIRMIPVKRRKRIRLWTTVMVLPMMPTTWGILQDFLVGEVFFTL
ncbi:MAG: hypothetical protein CM15mP111_3670 [Hyphomicrobiales bacterium]|nr:MAG: hypothetical protein CM15mP111_3670 [Hyphomicrobiales bacterium]